MRAIEKWLTLHDIKVDDIMAEKPPAHVYVDDRAICFDGDAYSLMHKIETFKPWNEKQEVEDGCRGNFRKGYVFGKVIELQGVSSEAEIKTAREKVVDSLCDVIRDFAKKRPEELFIEKDIGELHTVGAKFVIPQFELKK